MTTAGGGAEGKRASRRCSCARWLSVTLLFAAAPVETQFNQNNPPRFAVELSKSTVVEGESVTMRLCCTVNYTAYRFEDQAGANRNHHLRRIDPAVAHPHLLRHPDRRRGKCWRPATELSLLYFCRARAPTSARLQER